MCGRLRFLTPHWGPCPCLLFTACHCHCRLQSQVIAFDPMYDSYVAMCKMAGGVMRPVRLTLPDFSVPRDQLAAAFGPKTKFILLNSPHNPSGKVRPNLAACYLRCPCFPSLLLCCGSRAAAAQRIRCCMQAEQASCCMQAEQSLLAPALRPACSTSRAR